MTRLLACLLALAGLFPMAQATAQELQPLDGIVAVVDEDVILRSELDRALRNIQGQYAGRENQLPPRDILAQQVLERLVLVKLQVARAESTGIRVSDQELDRAINSIAQQNNTDIQGLAGLIARDGLLEHANNHGHWYGTPVDQVRGILAAGRDAREGRPAAGVLHHARSVEA